MSQYEQSDLDNAALCVWKEARGEGNVGMQAVAHVIFNRVGAPGFPRSLHDVVYQRNAFTSMSVPTDPEYSLMPHPNDPQYSFAAQIVSSIANGTDTDVTGGAHYYDNPKTATSGWFARHIVDDTTNHPFTATIGRQNFYV